MHPHKSLDETSEWMGEKFKNMFKKDGWNHAKEV